MSEVPLYEITCGEAVACRALCFTTGGQGYLAHKKTPTPLGPP